MKDKSIKLYESFTYVNDLKNKLCGVGEYINEMVETFEEFGQLTENLEKDAKIISSLYKYITEETDSDLDVDSDSFDPYSHLEEIDEIDERVDCLLTFGDTNEKMKKLGIVYFTLPAGYTCPMADICKSLAHKTGGKFKSNDKKIKDFGEFRCYSASTEMRFPEVREKNWRNFDLLVGIQDDVEEMSDLIMKSIKYYEYTNKKVSIMRIHEGGDFYTQEYFDAWLDVAKKRSDILFYAYTKSISFAVNRIDEFPKNFRIIGSVGGKEDDLLFNTPKMRKAFVVDSEEEAIKRKLRVDINDFLAVGGEEDFALLLHGTQPKESGKTNIGRENSKLAREKSKKFRTPKQMLHKIAQKYTT
jgi:hypothetical protein